MNLSKIILLFQILNQISCVAIHTALMKRDHFLRDLKKLPVRHTLNIAVKSHNHRPDIIFVAIFSIKPVFIRLLVKFSHIRRKNPLLDKRVHKLNKEARSKQRPVNIKYSYLPHSPSIPKNKKERPKTAPQSKTNPLQQISYKPQRK